METNPLILWNTQPTQFDEAFPFDDIKPEHFIPATEKAITQAKEALSKITQNPSSPSFENTIVALEEADSFLDSVLTVYKNLYIAQATTAIQNLASKIFSLSAEYESYKSLNQDLFDRINKLYNQKESLGLTSEDQMLLDKYYKYFIRNGALLNEQEKTILKKIDQELATLSPRFSENVLKVTQDYFLEITNSQDLKGLPPSSIEMAKEEAKKKSKPESWVFTLQAPSYTPFLQYCENSQLREQLWKANSRKAVQGDNSNQEIILKVVELREQRAQLLGFKTHSHFVLEERMAKNPETVLNFIESLRLPSASSAKKEFEELKDFALKNYSHSPLQPWDMSYFSEKLKESKFSFNEEELRPYFSLENVIQGVFLHAEKLFNLKFIQRNDIPKYHPEVTTYEVKDSITDEYIGLFYTDFFPRDEKKGGAWMTAFREQGLQKSQIKRPHISIVCNFTQPTQQQPSLLTLREVETLFHEFGHALHGLLSKCKYRSLSGTNVYWDFVELPSQIMENWVTEKEALDLFAKHYKNQNPMPDSLIKKVKDSNKFQSGIASLRQIQLAYLDMKWHLTPRTEIQDVLAFENHVTQGLRLFDPQPSANISCSFSHIFAGGYSSGYYSYKWAEVLDADAFDLFKQNGIFDKQTAQKFKENILMKGGTEHPEKLYLQFRGQKPNPQSLLKRSGLI